MPHNKGRIDLSLYLVTDRGLLPAGSDLLSVIAAAIEGGVTLVQLREKTLDTKSFVALARRVLAVCRAARVPLLINDRLDVALAVDADGVHIGQNDMPLATARALLGPDKIVGVTVENVEQALRAVAEGADYLGTAAIFATATKKHPDSFTPLHFDGVQEILKAVASYRIPVCTIGGINLQNVEDVLSKTVVSPGAGDGPGCRLQGVAVVSAIVAHADPKAASAALFAKIRPLVSPTLTLKAAPSGASASNSAVSVFLDQIAAAYNRLRSQKPLIHNITNYVVMNDTANVILQMGALPVMAHAVEEVEEITAMSQALVLNIGTLSPKWIDAMRISSIKAKSNSTPVVLDPVGAGATKFRTDTCKEILQTQSVTVLKGNAGEIAALGGIQGLKMRGVESVGELEDASNAICTLARNLATCVAMSGPVDTVSDGVRTVSVANGNEWLGSMTGTGCSTSAMIACFAAVEKDPLVAAVGGLLCMTIAAEVAVQSTPVEGPGSFKVALHDAISRLTGEQLRERARITISA
ncbi:hypothetical protein HDU86_003282 [Geranomyces michiganensis]|nr:hypothetical protein HDU86_003282 [Geranomyces michiganensis]